MLRLAVHLHMYYRDMWPDVMQMLSHIAEYDYDLYVTLSLENADFAEEIKSFNHNAKIFVIENRGYDIGPFVYFLHQINLSDYDLIMKLHTKNRWQGVDTHINNLIFSRELWVKTAIDALLGSTEQFEKNIRQFEKNKRIGMIGSKYLIATEKECTDQICQEVHSILANWGYKRLPIRFVAGSMFICRSNLLEEIKKHYTFADFPVSDFNIKDNTIAHVLERIVGCLVEAKGYQIKGFDLHKLCINTPKVKQNSFLRFLYQHKITRNGHEIIKFMKLPIIVRDATTKKRIQK